MWIRGQVASDRPDPAEQYRAAADALGVRVAGFVAQPQLEDWGVSAMSTTRSGAGSSAATTSASFSRMYTFWANPDDKSDPANLGELDIATRDALDASPTAELPKWVNRQRERMRYPSLWEAVQTHWFTDNAEHSRAPGELLRHHVDYVLHNQFRDEYGLDAAPEEWTELVSLASVQPTTMVIDGDPRAGVMIDTDAFVFGIGAALDDDRVITAVIDRTILQGIVAEFVSDAE